LSAGWCRRPPCCCMQMGVIEEKLKELDSERQELAQFQACMG
jgi:hypothetical protein